MEVGDKIRHKLHHEEVATVIGVHESGRHLWIQGDPDNDGPTPWTSYAEDWEPVPSPKPSEALTGDIWSYGGGAITRYRVLGVDLKAGIWLIVDDRDFEYKDKDKFAVQYEADGTDIYIRNLPADSASTLWNLVERP